jgi:hypothetical protein
MGQCQQLPAIQHARGKEPKQNTKNNMIFNTRLFSLNNTLAKLGVDPI